MNFGLRCEQIMAEEKAARRMNIIERTALWYRLERIGEDRPSLDFEDHSINETHTPEPEWTKRQWAKVQQVLLEIEHLRKQWYQHLQEDREYRANAKRKRKSYEYDSIK